MTPSGSVGKRWPSYAVGYTIARDFVIRGRNEGCVAAGLVSPAAPALAAPGNARPGPPGRPVAAGRRLVQSTGADRLADELRDVDAVLADGRRVRAGRGALHVVFAEDGHLLYVHGLELARRLAAEALGRRDDARRKRLCGVGRGGHSEEGEKESRGRHVVVVVVMLDGDGGLRGASSVTGCRAAVAHSRATWCASLSRARPQAAAARLSAALPRV